MVQTKISTNFSIKVEISSVFPVITTKVKPVFENMQVTIGGQL